MQEKYAGMSKQKQAMSKLKGDAGDDIDEEDDMYLIDGADQLPGGRIQGVLNASKMNVEKQRAQ